MTIISAVVTEVPIGNISVEGLMREDGVFGIAVPQIATLFPYFKTDKNNASTLLKRLMGKDFKPDKVKSEYNKNATSFIGLEDFLSVIKALGKKQDPIALSMIDALLGLSLHQLFCDAFGIKFEKEERQQYLAQRMQHRQHFHPYLTRWLKHDAGGDNNAVNWGWEVNYFKKACKLPLTGVDTWDYNLLQILNRAESGYNMLRIAGLNHDDAVAVIRTQH